MLWPGDHFLVQNNKKNTLMPQGENMDAPVEIWGEDALLQWPNARQPIIAERDAYMARTIWAAATGEPTEM